MLKRRLSDLSEAVRSFLTEAFQGDGIIVEDDTGRPQYSVSTFRYPTEEEERRADAGLDQLRKHTEAAMKKAGVTEDDIDRVLQEDD